MNPILSQQLTSLVRDRIGDKTKVKALLSIALGIALARTTPLPSSDLSEDSAEHYYNHALDGGIIRKICDFNEGVLVEIDTASTTARAFWLHRYYNAYPMKVIPLMGDDTHFMGKVMGTGHLIVPNTLSLCTSEDVTMIVAINRISELLTSA